MPVPRVLLAAAVSLSFYLINVLSAHGGLPAGQWMDVSNGIRGDAPRTISVSRSDPDSALLGSEHVVYMTTDGSTWKEVLSFRGTEKGINSVYISPVDNSTFFSGTDDGLYRSKNRGESWERIFSGIGNHDRSVLAVHVHPGNEQHISIGTRSGYFRSDSGGRDWHRSKGIPTDTAVMSFASPESNPAIMYAVTERGLYKSTSMGTRWEKILRSNYLSENTGAPDSTGADDYKEATGYDGSISIAIDQGDPDKLFAGTQEGILVSNSGGRTWKAAGNSSLFVKDIRDIAIQGEGIYAATPRGVYRYSETTDRWDNIYHGLVSTDILSLESVQNYIWAVSTKRVYKAIASENNLYSAQSDVSKADILKAFSHEPTVEEIRDAAIRYAELSPTKITKWRKAASRSAWLPDLRFEYSRDKDWQDSSYFYSGKHVDDDITVGRDKGWAVSFTWELSELIWNNDQTSIDNRSKLMVQLRDDILNEVTRLYYERRKLQVDMMIKNPAGISEEIEQELRLQELTASIDSLTGSFLSKRLRHGTGARVSPAHNP